MHFTHFFGVLGRVTQVEFSSQLNWQHKVHLTIHYVMAYEVY